MGTIQLPYLLKGECRERRVSVSSYNCFYSCSLVLFTVSPRKEKCLPTVGREHDEGPSLNQQSPQENPGVEREDKDLRQKD